MAWVIEILPCGKQGPIKTACSISWLLMAWQGQEPGHQQPWYWGSYPGTFKFQHQTDQSLCGLSQWETTLQCNVVSHWLSPYPEWTLDIISMFCCKYETNFQSAPSSFFIDQSLASNLGLLYVPMFILVIAKINWIQFLKTKPQHYTPRQQYTHLDPQLIFETINPKCHLQYQDHLSRYRYSHYKDKIVKKLFWSYNGNSHTDDRASLPWNKPSSLSLLPLKQYNGYLNHCLWYTCKNNGICK